MNFDEVSDAEINKAVAISEARYVKPPPFCEVEIIGDVENYYDGNRTLWACHASYCDSPDDAWPIIESILWELLAADEYGVTEWGRNMRDENDGDKLRAAMVVYLKLKEAQS